MIVLVVFTEFLRVHTFSFLLYVAERLFSKPPGKADRKSGLDSPQ